MNINTITSKQLVVDAWAEVPEGVDPQKFKYTLENLGNVVGKFDPDRGDYGSYLIGTFTEEK